MASRATTNPGSVELVRTVGTISLAAIAVNSMIGAGIFALPATVTQLLGPLSPLAYLVAGSAVLLIALCFAEVGSLFDRSGGPYLYARAAFGPFIGFEVGWIFVLARLTALAAVSNTFAAYLGFFWPVLAQGIGRLLAVTLLLGVLGAINFVGVRPGVWAINVLTVGKLIPLLTFCLVGLFFLESHSLSFSALPKPSSLQQASLLLVFAFGGFENASVPSGEVIEPKRVLPVALLSSVGLVVVLYLLIQVVAMGTLPGLATSPTPLASAALNFLGPAGGLLLTIGAVLSTTGNNSTAILTGSRALYALAQGGQLPAVIARIHPRYRTPHVSIVLFVFVGWAFAVSGTFAQLAALTVLARLLYYGSTCLAVPVLRRKMPGIDTRFTVPGGGLVPVLALGVCTWLLFGSSRYEVMTTAAALLTGAVLYALFARRLGTATSAGN